MVAKFHGRKYSRVVYYCAIFVNNLTIHKQSTYTLFVINFIIIAKLFIL